MGWKTTRHLMKDIAKASSDLNENRDVEIARARSAFFKNATQLLSIELKHAELAKRVDKDALRGVKLTDD